MNVFSKSVVLLFITIFFSKPLFSTDLSLYGGVSISKIRFSNVDETKFLSVNTKMKTGVGIGIQIGIPITEKISIVPGAELVSKGTRLNFTDVEEDYFKWENVKYKIAYLEIPVLFRYKFETGEKSRIFLSGGPYMGIALGASFHHKYADEYGSSEFNIGVSVGNDSYAVFRRLDAGLRLEATYEWNKIFLKGNYSSGLTNIAGKNNELTKAKNHSLHIGVGYRFEFKKKE